MAFIQLQWDYTDPRGIEGTSEAHSNVAWVSIFLTESVRNDGDWNTDTPRFMQFQVAHLHTCGRGSSVVIVTGYGLDGLGTESRWGRDFPHLSRPTLGSTQHPVQWVPGLSRG